MESIRAAIGRPTPTQPVQVVNPPPPVHAPINVTVYATTNAIAQQTAAKVQDELGAPYSDGAYV